MSILSVEWAETNYSKGQVNIDRKIAAELTLKQTLIRKIQLAIIISDLLMVVSNIFNNFTHTFQSSKFQSSISSFKVQYQVSDFKR